MHRLLSKTLTDGVRHKILANNVAGREGQLAPKAPRQEMKIIKKGEIDDVAARLRGTTIYAEAMVALFCGLRIGEILALRWGRVDLEQKILDVREAVEEVHGEPLTTRGPKTKSGIRKVTMLDVVVDALRDHRRGQNEIRMALGLGKPQDDTLVFPAADGNLKRSTNPSRTWRRIGAADVRFHDLRHTHASMLIAGKFDIVVISATATINAALGANSVPKKAK